MEYWLPQKIEHYYQTAAINLGVEDPAQGLKLYYVCTEGGSVVQSLRADPTIKPVEAYFMPARDHNIAMCGCSSRFRTGTICCRRLAGRM